MFSRDPLQNPELLKPKTYSITSTITAQLTTAFFSIFVGLVSLYLLAKMFDQLGRSFGIDADMSFGLLSLMPFLFYLIAIVIAVSMQFERSIPPERLKPFWKYLALGIGLLPGLMIAGISLTEAASFALLSVIYHLLQTLLLSLIVVTTQRIVLSTWSFDEMHHRWLMSADGNLWACKAGVMPYREKISSFWMMIIFVGFSLFFSSSLIFMLVFDTIPNTDTGDYILLVLLFLPFVGLFVWGSAFYWKGLKTMDFYVADGEITKSMHSRYSRSPAGHMIHLGSKDFATEIYLWNEMSEGSRYRLWYTVVGRFKKMIGFEKISEPQLADLPVPLAKEGIHPRQLSEKSLPTTSKKKNSPQIQELKRRRNAKRSKLPESH